VVGVPMSMRPTLWEGHGSVLGEASNRGIRTVVKPLSQVKSAWLLRPGGGQLSRSRSASWHVALLVCVANFCGLSVRWMMNEMRTTALLQRLE